VTYGELIGDKSLDVKFTGTAPQKPVGRYKLVGTRVPRLDIPDKVAAKYTHMQHVRVAGMLHGRVVRPRGQRGYGTGAKPLAIDETSIAGIAGARVVRRGDFVGVVAEREWDAVRAARMLKVSWDAAPTLPPFDQLHARMQSGPTQDSVVLQRGDAAKALAGGESVTLTGLCPYQAHAPFAPNCALADVKPGGAEVICSSQDIYTLRRELTALLGLKQDAVRVRFSPASGTYGHSCYDDVAQAAAVLSQLAKAPVRVQFMRWDELGWDTYGPAHVGKVTVSAGPDGKISGYQYDGWQHDWSNTEVTDQLATGAEAAEWAVFPSDQVALMTCGGQYAIPNLKLVNHRVPGEPWLRAAWLRSPLDLSCAFVSEQAIDQLAHRLGQDPYAFRKANIANERWAGVLDAVCQAAKWTARPAHSQPQNAQGGGGAVVRGRGVGLGTHLQSWGACVAELEVDKASGRVHILRLTGAIDAGLVVNPGIVEAQITGQLAQLTGRMLSEEVTFDEHGVTSLDWSSYRVLRFADCPEITPIVVQRLHEPSMGAGEECMAAGAAAVANAFFDATGVRMTRFPFTSDRVKAALA
jgi:nicotinate dehydrogenase subunit B